MKALMSTSLVVVILVSTMMNCSPLVGQMMLTMFEKYEELADSIICYAEDGSIQMSDEGANELLEKLGTQAEGFSNVVGGEAEEFLNNIETENSEETVSSFEELKGKAKECLDAINNLGKTIFG